jgi:drug/metabolite transporter (DMT)-like permease
MVYIIAAAIFYTAALIAIAAASRKIDSALLNGVGNTLSAVIPLVLAVPFLNQKYITNNRLGLLYAIIAGIFISIFGIFLGKSYAVNKVAIVSPLVFGGAIFLTAIISAFLFKEKISVVQGAGLAFLFVGLSLVVYARATGR